MNPGIPPLDTDNDGMPDSWETFYGTQPGIADDSRDIDTNGYTNIEEYINSLICDPTVIQPQQVEIAIKVFLQGPFDPNNGLMYSELRNQGLLPAVEPYTALGFTHVNGGGELVNSTILEVTGNNAIVDWIFIELRSGNDFTEVLATQSALLQSDGDVVSTDGISPVTFNGFPAGDYYVAIRHRNHLGIMTANAYSLSHNISEIDFTDGSAATYGTEAQTQVDGVKLMWVGDVNTDNQIKYSGQDNDRSLILQLIGGSNIVSTISGYHNEDCNMDGIVKYSGSDNDRSIQLVNIGGAVITNVKIGQLP